MTDVASRELRNNTRDLILRAASGEEIVITVDGVPMARLVPVTKPQFVPAAQLLAHRADAGMTDDLRMLLGDETTDDLPNPWA